MGYTFIGWGFADPFYTIIYHNMDLKDQDPILYEAIWC